jgi:hypothetical protein
MMSRTAQQKITYTEGRELEPNDEGRLEGEVPGDVVEDEAESERFHEVEETEYDPVGEPLNVVVRGGRFNSLEGEVGGEAPSYEI